MAQRYQKTYHQDINLPWDTKSVVTVNIMPQVQNTVENGMLKLSLPIGVPNGRQNMKRENTINDRKTYNSRM